MPKKRDGWLDEQASEKAWNIAMQELSASDYNMEAKRFLKLYQAMEKAMKKVYMEVFG